MKVERVTLRFADWAGHPHRLALRVGRAAGGFESATVAGVSISSRIEEGADRIMVRAQVNNQSAAPVRIETVSFDLSTGLPPSSPGRFFKHGYQSWSPSVPRPVGAGRNHPRDAMVSIVRLSHQSEARRPTEATEAETSELFTIVESADSLGRILAGFVGAGSQLTTLTVERPDRIVARALFDGVRLEPGRFREVESLMVIRGGQSAGSLAERWAASLGRRMKARIGSSYQRGWCSWYQYFHAIDEGTLRENLKRLASMKNEIAIDVVQLDDGFQVALGDWDRTNPKFPGGLKRLAAEIRQAGFRAGIWSAPFLAARDSRLMSEHPDWFIRHSSSGEPLRAGYNPNWTRSQDAFAYALDASNPSFRDHLRGLYRRIVHDFGFGYLKLDFLYAAAAEGIRHDPSMTRAETLRRGLEAIREGAGNRAFLLGCGCPIGAAVGIVDGMRIGPDVAPFWQAPGEYDEPSTAGALDAIVARSFMHRRLWLNDPDCVMLRRETALRSEERSALALAVGMSGGMLIVSDDMKLIDDEGIRLFRAVAELGAQVDRGSTASPPLALDLMNESPLRGIVQKTNDGALVMFLNCGERAERVWPARLGIGDGRWTLRETSGARTEVRQAFNLPPHAARLLQLRH